MKAERVEVALAHDVVEMDAGAGHDEARALAVGARHRAGTAVAVQDGDVRRRAHPRAQQSRGEADVAEALDELRRARRLGLLHRAHDEAQRRRRRRAVEQPQRQRQQDPAGRRRRVGQHVAAAIGDRQRLARDRLVAAQVLGRQHAAALRAPSRRPLRRRRRCRTAPTPPRRGARSCRRARGCRRRRPRTAAGRRARRGPRPRASCAGSPRAGARPRSAGRSGRRRRGPARPRGRRARRARPIPSARSRRRCRPGCRRRRTDDAPTWKTWRASPAKSTSTRDQRRALVRAARRSRARRRRSPAAPAPRPPPPRACSRRRPGR